MQRTLGIIIGMCMGIGSAYAEIECKTQGDFVRELFDEGYTEIGGGPIKGEVAKVVPEGSVALLMVDPTTKNYKFLVTRPDTMTCIYLEGMSWEKSGNDAKN